MARAARAARNVVLAPEDAVALWADAGRWASFVEGFQRVEQLDGHWPEAGAKLVWDSTPDGRGRVTEKVVEHTARRFATQVYEDRLHGRQTAAFAPGPEGGTDVTLTLDYELTATGPLRAVTDVLFIRPALRQALERTLRSFAVEAQEDAGLR